MSNPHFVASVVAGLVFYAGCAEAQTVGPPTARGVVFHDLNGNRARDPGEPGLDGVRVSNGRDITATDTHGRYSLAVDDDTILFVIKPRGWQVPMNEDQLPQFYYIHKPQGSPPSVYPGVPPTGPLPASVDFPLYPNEEADQFEAILFGDTQPRNLQEIDYIAQDVVAELTGTKAAFGVTLGDLVSNDLSLFEPLSRVIGLIGIPWYNVIGNHDINREAVQDHHSDETFEKHYGPSYYSFDHSAAHFIVVDDVAWTGPQSGNPGFYLGGLGAEQLEFIRNDLARIPHDQLVVLFMHLPLIVGWHEADRQALFRLLEARPLTFSVAAHTHWQAHEFLDQADGWHGAEPHHHMINVTVSGSWWRGEPDERGIPNAVMADGAPNGYSVITFDGTQYSVRYKAASWPADHQMRIHAPEQVAASEAAEVFVNVFGGSARSAVEMRLDSSEDWVPLEMFPSPDPYFEALKAFETQRGVPVGYRPLPFGASSPHLWRGMLPDGLTTGAHLIEVRTIDMFGNTHRAGRVVRVVDPRP